MIFVMLGPSGCGKGTQAALLAQKLSIPSFSTGGLIREEAASGNVDALKAKEYADRGIWPPDVLVEGIISKALLGSDVTKGFILDGSPRTVAQAKWLDQLLLGLNMSLGKAIHLETSLVQSLERMRGRISQEIKTGKVRSDETESAIKERFESYAGTIAPIKEYYGNQGKLILINNEQPIGNVHKEICRKLNL